MVYISVRKVHLSMQMSTGHWISCRKQSESLITIRYRCVVRRWSYNQEVRFHWFSMNLITINQANTEEKHQVIQWLYVPGDNKHDKIWISDRYLNIPEEYLNIPFPIFKYSPILKYPEYMDIHIEISPTEGNIKISI